MVGDRRVARVFGSVTDVTKDEAKAKVAPFRDVNGNRLEIRFEAGVRKLLKKWSGRRDSNPRRPAWELRARYNINNITAQVFGSGASNTLEFLGVFQSSSK